MKKTITKLTMLLFMLVMGVGNVWGDSYTITFKVGTGDGTSISTTTAYSAIVSDGLDYLSGTIGGSDIQSVYCAGVSGLKLGASSASGKLVLNLSSEGQVTPTSIVVNAKLYNSSKATTLSVNGSATQNLTADFADYSYEITSAITTLTLQSSKYCWVSSITVNYNTSSTKTLTSIAVSGTPTKTTYTEGETFDPAGLIVTGTYDDGTTGDVTSLVEWEWEVETFVTAGTYSVYGQASVGSVKSERFNVSGITVNAVSGDIYELCSGTIEEGDYLIVYDGVAMNKTVASNRLQYEEVTINGSRIMNNDNSIVWHIAPFGDYWTIQNAANGVYAASSGSKNQAVLSESVDDKSLWTVSGTSTYEFVNKQNAANGVNSNLRRNGTYGFACYAAATGGALSLYKKIAQNAISKPTFSPAGGTFMGTQSVSISCATEGATIVYTTDDWATFQTYTEPFTITETATVKAKVTKDGEESGEAFATFTKLTLTTCAEANGLAKDEVAALNDVTVAYVNGAYIYVMDESGYTLVYKFDYGLKAGDVVSGLTGKGSPYNGLPEMVPTVALSDLTITEGTAPNPLEFTSAPAAADVNKYIVLKGVVASETAQFTTEKAANAAFTLGENTVNVRNAFKLEQNFTQGVVYDLVGTVALYNGVVQVYFISATEAGAEKYAISFSSSIANGTVVADTEEAAEGTLVTLTVTPDSGYKLGEISVNKLDGEPVELADDYKFTMPASGVIVSATFVGRTQYTVTYISRGTQIGTEQVYEGDVCGSIPAVTNGPEGWVFAGWTEQDDEYVPELFDVDNEAVAKDTELHAVFSKTVDGDNDTYSKVTEDLADWSGEYLLVYEGEDVAYAWTGVDAGQCHADVTIANGVITEVPESAATLTIAPMEGGYSIMVNGSEKDGLYIGQSAYSNGLTFSDEAALNTLSIDEEGNAVITAEGGCTMKYNKSTGETQERFRYYKSGQQPVQLYKKSGETYYTVYGPNYIRPNIENKIGTFCYDKLSVVAGVELYEVANIEMDAEHEGWIKSITFAEVGEVAESSTPYVFKATSNKLEAYIVGASENNPNSKNGLVGNLKYDDPVTLSESQYMLQDNKVKRSNGTATISQYRAYIDPAEYEGPTEVKGKSFTIEFENEVTSINSVMKSLNEDGDWYTIDGRKVAEPTKGIFIKNGVKYMFK